jgi:hypothetical protein
MNGKQVKRLRKDFERVKDVVFKGEDMPMTFRDYKNLYNEFSEQEKAKLVIYRRKHASNTSKLSGSPKTEARVSESTEKGQV